MFAKLTFQNSYTLKVFNNTKQQKVSRHFWKNMECLNLHPPQRVRGMTQINREAFRKTIKVPKLKVPEEQSNKVIPLLKKCLLKMDRLKPVGQLPRCEESQKVFKEILLHPLAVSGWESLPDGIKNFDIPKSNFYFGELELTYENWRADEILKYVLPEDQDSLTSYSRVGHIVHINLRDHLIPYKQLIGQVLLDKVAGCRTVVNKAKTIDNTYRNFQVELVCGEPDYKAEVKENGIVFEFDFSKVYWNPRLSTEHERIVQILQPNDVLYDVFAGVGPFSVPAAKKKCRVLANDLNPESFKWLNQNAKRNKCTENITTFNKDGRDFILENLRTDLLAIWKRNEKGISKIHVTMNLPAMSVEFLDAFRGLMSCQDVPEDKSDLKYPLVHVYSFAKGENTKNLVKEQTETHLGFKLADNLDGIYFVRNVAPMKDMYRVSFFLTEEILFHDGTGKQSRKRPSSTELSELNCKIKI